MLGTGASKEVRRKLARLESHLKDENELLVEVVASYRKLDRVAYAMGLLGRDESYATQISWWPLISVLGTFSSGKSSFLNHYLQYSLQESGTQAVDDKFTVVSYSSDRQVRELPGNALNSDPRFPFYQIDEELEKVAPEEKEHVDGFLRLKTCPAEDLRGKILIDSPGFDADSQRTSTLRITDYIIDLSDLVLVFFDARHPEPGAMKDTLTHLVSNTFHRRDSSKFLYVLNQIDTTAQEDNPEDVVSSWQRALAQEGLTAGRFYTIYNPDMAVTFDDPALQERFERKRDEDLEEIHRRMNRVNVERAYRIIGSLEKTAQEIEQERLPVLREALRRWRRGVAWRDGLVLGALVVVLGGGSIWAGYWDGLTFQSPGWLDWLLQRPIGAGIAGVVVVALLAWIHFTARNRSAVRVVAWLQERSEPPHIREQLKRAFRKSTRAWRSVFRRDPAGWNKRNRKRIQSAYGDADYHVEELNDRFTNPSGGAQMAPEPAVAASNDSAPQTEAGAERNEHPDGEAEPQR